MTTMQLRISAAPRTLVTLKLSGRRGSVVKYAPAGIKKNHAEKRLRLFILSAEHSKTTGGIPRPSASGTDRASLSKRGASPLIQVIYAQIVNAAGRNRTNRTWA